MRRKNRKRDRAYLEFIGSQQCAVCLVGRPSVVPWSRVEAHHAGVRGLMQKSDDRTAIPLCAQHHRLGRDSVHRLGKNFWAHHGLDKDTLIAEYNRAYENK